MFRSSPSSLELADRSPLVLTSRDHELLNAVYSHGLLDMQAIELAFFPPRADGRSSSSSAAYDRVKRLWSWGFLDRIELPVAPRLGGRRPYLYALGRRGVSAVAASNSKSTRLVQRRRLDRMDDLFVDHDLKAGLFWANLANLIRGSRVPSWDWTSERDIRAQKRKVKDYDTGKWLRVLPDAEFNVRYPDGARQWCFLEIDMGTLTLNRFRQKVRAFDLYAGAVKRQNGEDAQADFEVYVLTLSAGRLEQLRQATLREIGHGQWARFYFGTFDQLDPAKFDADWICTDGKPYGPLYEQAFDNGPAGGESEPQTASAAGVQ
jgi:hypothetical protein